MANPDSFDTDARSVTLIMQTEFDSMIEEPKIILFSKNGFRRIFHYNNWNS